MNKKNINRILIVVVALIWGILIYRFISTMFVSNTIEADTIISQGTIAIPQIEKDTFNLKSYGRDPFLGVLNRTSKPITNRTNSKNQKKEIITNNKWPKIKYLGFVKEEKSNDPLLLIKINDKLFRKKANGEFIEGLKIVSFYKDSLEVNFNYESRMIKRN